MGSPVEIRELNIDKHYQVSQAKWGYKFNRCSTLVQQVLKPDWIFLKNFLGKARSKNQQTGVLYLKKGVLWKKLF